ncbi:Uncharacterized protein Rs2_29581 [Raphanus sativus]|nr:Uncharacterized protein Rs2_29581 [Raphanus sativus]
MEEDLPWLSELLHSSLLLCCVYVSANAGVIDDYLEKIKANKEIQKRYEMLPDKESVDGGLMLEAEKNDGWITGHRISDTLYGGLFVVSFLRERTHGRTRIVCVGFKRNKPVSRRIQTKNSSVWR